MSSAAITHDSEAHSAATHATAKFGMVIFLISEAMLFAGLIGGYIVLRLSTTGDWPPAGAPDIGVNFANLSVLNIVMIVNTLILISSSFTLHASEVAIIKKGKSGLGWMLLTIVLGTIFLSVQAWEWAHLHHEGLWFNSFGVYGASFFVITGFHGLHVFVGLLLIVWCFLRQLFTKCFSAQSHASLANVSLYWHFVDVVWVVVYFSLYVI